MNFETVIGLEVHVELNTNSKIFSPTSAHFGNEQNTNTNVIDWSFPGVLPVLNKGVVDAGIKAALALNMDIHQHMHFDRKNYFYPDNPKAYQISQFDEPIGYNGWIEVQLEDGTTKKIGIERAHLEEDAGKNTHGTDGFSYVDLNRQGVPLIEIVSEADMRSPEEAYAYLTALKEVIQYTGISDVKMEEGSMRVDANISLRPYGQEEFGTKTELKNLNSFSNVRKGLEYEVQRQAKILRSGGVIRQETRRYDEASKSTILMRVKEGAADYRYFPEPDLPLFEISDEWIEEMRTELPEFPKDRRARYVAELGLSDYDANQLTATKVTSDFFEAAVALGGDAKQVSNWLQGEVAQFLNAEGKTLEEIQADKPLADTVVTVYTATQRFFRIVQVYGAQKTEANGLIEFVENLIVFIYDIITRRIRMARIKADTYARLVFHTVDDMFQLPKLIAYIAALSCRIFNDRRYALRLA